MTNKGVRNCFLGLIMATLTKQIQETKATKLLAESAFVP